MKTPPPYHYVESGLHNVWLVDGVEHVDSPYGKGVSIKDLDGLHRRIAQCLVQKPGPLTGAEFRFLRVELDLSQSAVGRLCRRDHRTVRGWESSDAIAEPENTIIRHVYRQRFNRSVSFERLSLVIQESQLSDREPYEFKLQMTDGDWNVIAASATAP